MDCFACVFSFSANLLHDLPSFAELVYRCKQVAEVVVVGGFVRFRCMLLSSCFIGTKKGADVRLLV